MRIFQSHFVRKSIFDTFLVSPGLVDLNRSLKMQKSRFSIFIFVCDLLCRLVNSDYSWWILGQGSYLLRIVCCEAQLEASYYQM